MRISHHLVVGSILSALVAAGAVATPAAATPGASASPPPPVATTTTEAPLEADGVSARSSSAPVVLGATAESTGHAVAGVVWDDTDDVDVTSVDIRTLSDDAWSGWETVALEDTAEGMTAGTVPVVIGDVDKVQVRLEADSTPANARLTVIDPGTSTADSTAAQSARADAAPEILTRADWGADESIMTWTPQQGQVTGAVISHTVNVNNYSPEAVPGMLRGIYTYHATALNWGDIGYNFIVDRFGRAWEGRAGGMENQTIGAHTSGFNAWTTGVSMLGNHNTAEVTDEAWDTLADLLAWKLSLHGVDASGTMSVNGTSYPAIIGHRDASATESPGDLLYERLDDLRHDVSERQAG